MIERVIGHLADHGIEEAVLSLGYRPDAFMNAYPDGTIAGVRLTYAVEPEPLDTAGAIRFAARHGSVDETFVVVNGDVLTDVGPLGADRLPPAPRCRGHHRPDPDGGPERLRRRPHRRRGTGPGLHREAAPRRGPDQSHQRRHLHLRALGARPHPPDVRVSVERETFPAMVEDGTLFAQGSDAYWLDTGTPDAYLRAHRDLILGRRAGPPGPRGGARPRHRARGVADRGRRGVRAPPSPGPSSGRGCVGGHRCGGRGVGDRCRRRGRGRGLGHRLGAPARGPGGVQGHGGGIGDRAGGDRGPTMRDPRPVGDRCRRHHGVGNRHRRRTDRRRGSDTCARWSPAGPGSSARPWWTGSWPRATRWTWSTTSPPAPWPTWPTPAPRPATS